MKSLYRIDGARAQLSSGTLFSCPLASWITPPPPPLPQKTVPRARWTVHT
jgi:hypothetical protein